jgi:hypothetical protein
LDCIKATQVSARYELEDLLLLRPHRFQLHLSEEGGELHLLEAGVFVEVEAYEEVLGTAFTTAVRSN